MRRLLTFLLLVSAAAATVQFFNVPASADPAGSFSFVVNVYNDSGSNYVQGDTVTVQVYKSGSASTDINCSAQGTTNSAGNVTVLCDVSSNAYNVSYTLNATSSTLTENNSNTTTVGVNTLTLVVNSNTSSVYPGEGITFTVNATNSTGGPVSGVTITPSSPCSGSAGTNSSGHVSFSCTVPEGTTAGTHAFNATSNNGQGSAQYTVLEKWQNPAVSHTTLSNLEKGQNNTNVMNITVTNRINAAHNYTISLSCNDSRIIPSATPGTILISSYDGTGTFSVSINVSADVPAGQYTCAYNISCVENQSYYNYSSFTVTVNPYHNFTLGLDNDTKAGTPGASVQFTLQVNNTGEQADTFSAVCSVDNANYSCSVSPASQQVSNSSSYNFTITVNVPLHTDKNNRTLTVNVTDSYETKQTTATIVPGDGYDVELVSNSSSNTFYGNANDTVKIAVYLKNTANADDDYNVSVSISDWLLKGYSLDAGAFENTSNFNMSVSAFSNETIWLNVTIPENTAACTTKTVTITANSKNNASSSDSLSLTVGTACFDYDVRVWYNSTNLNISMYNITLGGAAQNASFTWRLYYPNGTTLTGADTFSGSRVQFFTSTNTSSWPVGVYNISMNVSDDGLKGEYSGQFVFARSAYLSLLGGISGQTSYCQASRKNLTVYSYVEGLSSVPISPTTSSTGISCAIVGTSGYTYTIQCYFGGTAGQDYNLTVSNSYSNCAQANLTCTVSPAITKSSTLTGISIISCTQDQNDNTQTTNQDSSNQQSGDTGSLTSSQQSSNETTANEQNLNLSLGLALKVSGKNQITLLVENRANVSGNITVQAEEEGEWKHFNFTIPKVEISAKEAINYKVNYTVLEGVPPGKYNVTLTIMNQTRKVTITVPEPDNNKTVNRYLEKSVSGNKTRITLYVRNLEDINKTFNITETIPKTIAQNISEVTIITNESYQVINPDPVILWTFTLGPGESKKISYVVNKMVKNETELPPPLVEAQPLALQEQEEQKEEKAAGYDPTGVLVMGILTLMFVWIIVSYLYMEPFYKPVLDSALEKVGLSRQPKKRPPLALKKKRMQLPKFKKRAEKIIEKSGEIKEEVVSEYEVKPEASEKKEHSVEDLLDWIKK